MYAQIFIDIGRLPQLTKYYHKCHKVGTGDGWGWRDGGRDGMGDGNGSVWEWLVCMLRDGWVGRSR